MKIVRHNAWAELRGPPAWFVACLTRHLSVPIELGTEKGERFGVLWTHEGQRYGSLVKGLRVPAGLVPHVVALARHYGVRGTLIDARERPEDQLPWWSVTANWRDYQDDVHKYAIRASRGVIDAPPRSGKTLMAARIIDTHGRPCVVVAPSVQIVRQTYEVLKGFYGDDFVARLDGDATPAQRDPSKPIVVATAPSAAAMEREWWDTRELLIIDEFHHAAAETYHRINVLASSVYYRYGLTGTHFRSGDDALAMEAVCSIKLYRIPPEWLIERGYLAEPVVVFQNALAKKTGGHDWRASYRKGIVQCEERNELVVRTVRSCLDAGLPTIVLTRHRKHADNLGEMIGEPAQVVKGGENVLTSRVVKEFGEGRFDVLVGTTVIGEGVDVPRAAALVYASGGNDGVPMMQSYYRPLTKREGKAQGFIYDFDDTHHAMLAKHSGRRIEMAREQLGAARVHTV